MKRFIPLIMMFALSSCATKTGPPVYKLVDPKVYEKIQAEVSNGGSEIKNSLSELKWVRENVFPVFRTIEIVELTSLDGQLFQVMTLSCPSASMPGESFILAYLKNSKGKIVHWKSRWLSNRQGNLGTRLLDVNEDGVKEFCFVSKPFKRPEQLLSAYCVQEQKFEPVIAEQLSLFDVEFTETVLPDGLVLQPQLKGKYAWETDKLYEIPVRVINTSNEDRSLKGCSLWFSDEVYGGGVCGAFTVENLKTKDSTDTTIVARFTQMPHDSRLGFKMSKMEDH